MGLINKQRINREKRIGREYTGFLGGAVSWVVRPKHSWDYLAGSVDLIRDEGGRTIPSFADASLGNVLATFVPCYPMERSPNPKEDFAAQDSMFLVNGVIAKMRLKRQGIRNKTATFHCHGLAGSWLHRCTHGIAPALQGTRSAGERHGTLDTPG